MIEFLNIKAGDLFSHSIVYLIGYCVNFSTPLIKITDEFGDSISWSIVNNYFKVTLFENF